jgi:cyclophilin family peptidyl-prolyl cis-trans isomerase
VFAEVTLHTNVGDITFRMRADAAPGTVDNFLDYIDAGRYEDVIFHRMVPGFVLQGGGFTSSELQLCDAGCTLQDVDPSQFGEVETFDPIDNEFKLSNVRGTVAMAKLGGDPDSATSQFFINYADNSGNLDSQNGGFTVFAEVVDMSVADEIGTFPQANLSTLFPSSSRLTAISQAPLDVTTNTDEVRLVRIESITRTSVLHGNFFIDADNDGTFDESESGLAGLTAYIDANDNGIRDGEEVSVTADDDGSFHFIVEPGTHKVRVVSSSLNGYFGTNDAVAEGLEAVVRAGGDVFDLDFGFRFLGDSWHNPNNPMDVNGDNIVSPVDAIIVINELQNRAVSDEVTGALVSRTGIEDQSLLAFYDTNNDSFVAPLDALLVINALPSSSNPPAAALSAVAGVDGHERGAATEARLGESRYGGDARLGESRYDAARLGESSYGSVARRQSLTKFNAARDQQRWQDALDVVIAQW